MDVVALAQFGFKNVVATSGTATTSLQVEILFNMAALACFYWMRRKNSQTHQHFHIYLLAYGVFRFLHEFLRDTPKPFLYLSGYQIICLILAGVAIIAYRRRSNMNHIRS